MRSEVEALQMKPFGFSFLLSVWGNWSVTATRVNRCTERAARHITCEQWKPNLSLMGLAEVFPRWRDWREALEKQRGRLVRRKQVFKMPREVSAVQVTEGSHYRSPQRPGCKNCWVKAKPLFQSLFLPPKIDYVQEIKGHKPRDIVVPSFHHLRYPLPNVNIYPENPFSALCCFVTNCTIILQLLWAGEQGNPSVECYVLMTLPDLNSEGLCFAPPFHSLGALTARH